MTTQLLVHQLPWGAALDELLAEVRAGYSGAVVNGHDLMLL